MAQLLAEIPWGESLLPPVSDPAWEAEIKRRGGQVAEVDRRVAPNAWLREACLGLTTYRASAIPDRLFHIGAMVTSQENSCRYCYGANRAYMKILGYSESFISRIERDAHLAELDDKERAFIAFCRNLARSRPRPSRADRDALVQLGYSQLAVHEMALVISMGCFYNRIGLLMACPPEAGFERMANGLAGRLIGMAGPLVRALAARRRVRESAPALDAGTLTGGAFGPILAPLIGLPGAGYVKAALDGSFASATLPRRTKALMFAIVARTLGSRLCEDEARRLLAAEDFAQSEIESALATLNSSRLPPDEARMLPWVRGTVHYQVAAIQNQTRALGAAVGPSAVLEAIGVAALANATVRLAMLVE
jgi:alkylhydroperoxidase family enzyme